MKKILAIVLGILMSLSCVSFVACGETSGAKREPVALENVKVGLICLHGEESTYDKNFIGAMKEAVRDLGMKDSQLIIKTQIPEDNECYNAATDLADQGCQVIFADSFGHEPYIVKAAKEFPHVEFCHATGTQEIIEKLSNFHNAFAAIYEGRYLAGVVAGLKLKEMIENNTLPVSAKKDGENYIVGYVGAWPYAEVKSGYTSWFLGVRSVVPNVVMKVQFTNSWYEEKAEKSAAENLISLGAAIISQHADSMGAPSACEAANKLAGVPNVAYNGSTKGACPNTFLVSSRINWAPYFKHMINAIVNGTAIKTNYVGTFADGSVELSELGNNVAEGTAAKIEAVKSQITAGTLKVFDVSKFTVNGKHLTEYIADVIDDGKFVPETNVVKTANGITYIDESDPELRSAPYFAEDIDGITIITAA